MRNSNGHEIIHMNKFITNAYPMQSRKTLISLPMIRTYMVICLLHMYQLSTGIRPLPTFFFAPEFYPSNIRTLSYSITFRRIHDL